MILLKNHSDQDLEVFMRLSIPPDLQFQLILIKLKSVQLQSIVDYEIQWVNLIYRSLSFEQLVLEGS